MTGIAETGESRLTHWRQQMIACGAIAPEGARAFIFDWLIGLPPEIDPALAARSLLQGEATIADSLKTLLADIAAYPAPRLQRIDARRRLTRPCC